jgi:hypothetical protein
MKRIFLGAVVALTSVCASAGSQPPLPVSLKAIPEDMDQRRPIDVSIVGPSAGVEQVTSSFGNIVFTATKGQQTGGWIESSPWNQSVTVPTTVRMVTFMPYSHSSPPSTDIAGFPCQATYYLSQDGGSSWSRIMETMWSAPNFAPSNVALPVPIVIPPGVTITAKLRLWMPDGPNDGGCRVRAALWVTRP